MHTSVWRYGAEEGCVIVLKLHQLHVNVNIKSVKRACSLVTGVNAPLWRLLIAVQHFPGPLVVLETTKPSVRSAVSPAQGSLRHLQLGGKEML